MAESIVQVTEGVGKKLHTWSRVVGASTVEDEFVLPAEYPLPSYTTIALVISFATVNDHILQLMAGAALNVRIRRIRITQHAGATAAAAGAINVVRLTTAGTGGTVVTPRRNVSADAAAGATAMTLPTVKGTEGDMWWAESYNARQTPPAGGGPNVIFEWLQHPGEEPLTIAAGVTNGIAIKSTVAIAAMTGNVVIEFVETAFV